MGIAAEPTSDADAFATLTVPGVPPPGLADEMTARFQKDIRNSPLWDQMVDEFGAEKAEELLLQFKARIEK